MTASEEWSESVGANLQYHNDKGLTVFGDISYGWDGFKQTRHYAEIFKRTSDAEETLTTLSDETAKKRSQSLTADGGLNYDFGKNSAGIKYIFSRTPKSKFTSEGNSSTDVLPISDITSTTSLDAKTFDHYINAFGDFKLPLSIGLRADFDYMFGENTSCWDAKEEETERIITNSNKSNHDYFGAKLRIDRKLGDIEVEAGAEYAYTKTTKVLPVTDYLICLQCLHLI